MELKVKKLHPDAALPVYASDGAACFDLHAVAINGFTEAEHTVLKRAHKYMDKIKVQGGDAVVFRTGLAFEIPPGWAMMIYSRSGHGFKHGVRLANCVGIIDSDYRGEVQVKLTADDVGEEIVVSPGDRIAQAMLVQVPKVSIVEVQELSETERGEGGFGSTGA